MKKSASDTIAFWHLDTTAAAAGEGFEKWLEVSHSFYDLRALGGSEAFKGKATGHILDQLMFIDSRFDGLQVGRSLKHLRRAPSEYVFLHIFESGSMSGLLDDTPICKQPGSVAVQDVSHVLHAVAEPSKVKAVVVPYHVLGFEPGRHQPFMSLPLDEPKGRIVAGATQAIFDRLPGITEAEAPAIAEGYAGLLRGMLFGSAAEADRRSTQAALLAAILSYIDAHVRDRDLGAETLCDVFGLSRASLYRIMQSEGGVLHAIQQRRLHRCFLELSGREEGTTVRCIAERYGFSNPSHFNRLFKQLYLLSPSDLRPLPQEQSERQDRRPCAAAKTLNAWLERNCTYEAPGRRIGPEVRTAAE